MKFLFLTRKRDLVNDFFQSCHHSDNTQNRINLPLAIPNNALNLRAGLPVILQLDAVHIVGVQLLIQNKRHQTTQENILPHRVGEAVLPSQLNAVISFCVEHRLHKCEPLVKRVCGGPRFSEVFGETVGSHIGATLEVLLLLECQDQVIECTVKQIIGDTREADRNLNRINQELKRRIN